jgi:hypothetical protein
VRLNPVARHYDSTMAGSEIFAGHKKNAVDAI